MSALPLISCLCVTTGRRPALLAEAVESFRRQTWPRKELLIVCDGPAARIEGPEVRWIQLDPAPGDVCTLGRLRNRAMAAAAGELLCQWDDDDLSHPKRLAVQAQALGAADACFFTEQLQLFTGGPEGRAELYWNDWRSWARGEAWSAIPGTLMLRASVWGASGLRYPEAGPTARRGEDSALLSRLDAGRIVRLGGQGHLTLYRSHGANTFDRAHHRSLLRGGLGADALRAREGLLRAALAAYPLRGRLEVCAPAGPVFTIDLGEEARHAA